MSSADPANKIKKNLNLIRNPSSRSAVTRDAPPGQRITPCGRSRGRSPDASAARGRSSPPTGLSRHRKMRRLLQICESRFLRFAESQATPRHRSCLDGRQWLSARKKLLPATTATSARRCFVRWIWKNPAALSAKTGRRGSCHRGSRCSCSGRRDGPAGHEHGNRSSPIANRNPSAWKHSLIDRRAPSVVLRGSIFLMNGSGR